MRTFPVFRRPMRKSELGHFQIPNIHNDEKKILLWKFTFCMLCRLFRHPSSWMGMCPLCEKKMLSALPGMRACDFYSLHFFASTFIFGDHRNALIPLKASDFFGNTRTMYFVAVCWVTLCRLLAIRIGPGIGIHDRDAKNLKNIWEREKCDHINSFVYACHLAVSRRNASLIL